MYVHTEYRLLPFFKITFHPFIDSMTVIKIKVVKFQIIKNSRKVFVLNIKTFFS